MNHLAQELPRPVNQTTDPVGKGWLSALADSLNDARKQSNDWRAIKLEEILRYLAQPSESAANTAIGRLVGVYPEEGTPMRGSDLAKLIGRTLTIRSETDTQSVSSSDIDAEVGLFEKTWGLSRAAYAKYPDGRYVSALTQARFDGWRSARTSGPASNMQEGLSSLLADLLESPLLGASLRARVAGIEQRVREATRREYASAQEHQKKPLGYLLVDKVSGDVVGGADKPMMASHIESVPVERMTAAGSLEVAR